MKKIFYIFKFVVRFFFVLTISLSLIMSAYIYYGTEDVKIIEKAIEKIVININTNKDYNIEILGISEKWDRYGLTISADTIKLSNNKTIIIAKETKLNIDIIKTIIDGELKLKKISSNDILIDLKDQIEKTNNQSKDDFKDDLIKKIISEIDKTSLELKNINIKSNEKNINLKNINIYKNKFDNSLFIYKNKNLETVTKYNYKDNILDIKTDVKTDSKYIIDLINKLGFEDFLKTIKIDDIYSIKGNILSTIKLKINLKESSLEDYNFNIKLNGNKIILNPLKEITLTNAIGEINYSKKGLSSNEIIANLNRKKTKINITQKEENSINFKFETTLDLDKISKITKTPINKILEGSDKFYGLYTVNFYDVDSLVLESDFSNIKYKTKTNFKKNNGFKMESFLDYKNEKINFKIKQGENNVNLNFIDDKLYNINIGINKEITKKSKEMGILVNGFLDEIELSDLISDLLDFKKHFDYEEKKDINYENNKEIFDKKININIKNIKIKKYLFNDINLLYQNNTASLLFNEENAIGSVYYNEVNNDIIVNIDKLVINTSKTKEIIKESDIIDFEINEENEENEENSNSEIYKIKINASDIIIDGSNSISIFSNLTYKNGIIESDLIDIKDNVDSFYFKAKYQYDFKRKTNTITQIKKDTPIFEIKNIENFKKGVLILDSDFKSENVKFFGNFSWENFNIIDFGKTITGFFTIELTNGKIPNNSSEVGFAKALNIFNVNSLIKMITFDFEDVKNGLKFNSIKGNFNIKNNILSFAPRIIMDSDLFILEITGNIDYIDNEYDIKIDSIVPLINKAPIIAIIAGAAPEIVGLIWIVDKLAGSALNDAFTRSNYNIKGTFENPIYNKK